MNVRQQKYKKNVMLGMSKHNAAIAAGYSEATARKHTKELDQRVGLEDLMERQGLTDQVLNEHLKELLIATKVIGYLHQYTEGAKGGVQKAKPGEVVSNEFIDTPDHAIRAKALELAYKLKGKLRDKIDHSLAITYTEMKQITIEDKRMKLDLGVDVPEKVKGRT